MNEFVVFSLPAVVHLETHLSENGTRCRLLNTIFGVSLYSCSMLVLKMIRRSILGLLPFSNVRGNDYRDSNFAFKSYPYIQLR
jgi:hypothetical protein